MDIGKILLDDRNAYENIKSQNEEIKKECIEFN